MLMMFPPPGTYVEVVHLDHHQPAGPAWWTVEDVRQLAATTIITCGILAHVGTDSVVIVSTVAPADEHTEELWSAPYVIVRSCITSMRSLVPCG